MPPVSDSGTSLDLAALNSTRTIIDLLLAHGAKLEDSNPLHMAVSNNNHSIPIVEHLVTLGMNMNALKYYSVVLGYGGV